MLYVHPWVIKKHKAIVTLAVPAAKTSKKTKRVDSKEINVEDTENNTQRVVEGGYGNLYWGSPVKA